MDEETCFDCGSELNDKNIEERCSRCDKQICGECLEDLNAGIMCADCAEELWDD